MAEGRIRPALAAPARARGRAAWTLGGVTLAFVAATTAGAIADAAEPPPASAARAKDPARTAAPAPANTAPADSSAEADAEFLEFLGSDDGDAELQQYLAQHEPRPAGATRAPVRDGSEQR